MKIDVYCLCKNEIKLLPFFIDYWKALADDVDVYIYDGNSTDGCREEFAKHDWIHVIDFETDALDDNNHRLLKNECWKQSRGKADFVMVSDFDETIFSYDVQTLREELIRMKTAGGTILLPLSFNLIPDTFPEYQEGKYLHELAQYGFNDAVWEAKPILFDPNNIDEYNVSLGGHTAFPTGNVKWYISKKLFLVHAKFLGYDYYEERIRQRNVSQWNLDNGIDGEQGLVARRGIRRDAKSDENVGTEQEHRPDRTEQSEFFADDREDEIRFGKGQEQVFLSTLEKPDAEETSPAQRIIGLYQLISLRFGGCPRIEKSHQSL